MGITVAYDGDGFYTILVGGYRCGQYASQSDAEHIVSSAKRLMRRGVSSPRKAVIAAKEAYFAFSGYELQPIVQDGKLTLRGRIIWKKHQLRGKVKS